jgi:hypothetical protein
VIAEGKITAEEAEQLFKAMRVVEGKPTSDSPDLALSAPLSQLSHPSAFSTAPAITGRSSAKDLSDRRK